MEYCSNNAYMEFWSTVMWKWANIMPRKKDEVERRYDVKLYEVTLCLVRHNLDILKLILALFAKLLLCPLIIYTQIDTFSNTHFLKQL